VQQVAVDQRHEHRRGLLRLARAEEAEHGLGDLLERAQCPGHVIAQHRVAPGLHVHLELRDRDVPGPGDQHLGQHPGDVLGAAALGRRLGDHRLQLTGPLGQVQPQRLVGQLLDGLEIVGGRRLRDTGPGGHRPVRDGLGAAVGEEFDRRAQEQLAPIAAAPLNRFHATGH
jgi:hypothetical protein